MPDHPAPPSATPATPAPGRVRRCGALLPRERGWRLAVAGTFFGVFGAVFLFALVATLTATRLYQSESTFLVLPPIASRIITTDEGGIDLNWEPDTLAKLLESQAILHLVAERLRDGALQAYLAPYMRGSTGIQPKAEALLAANRTIVVQQTSRMVVLQYRHPDRLMASKVARLFAEELINYRRNQQIEEELRWMDSLSDQLDQRKARSIDLTNRLQTARNDMALVRATTYPRTGRVQPVDVNALQHEWEANESALQRVTENLQRHYDARTQPPSMRIINSGTPTDEGDYVYLNLPSEFTLGFLRALACGLAAAGAVRLAHRLATRQSAA